MVQQVKMVTYQNTSHQPVLLETKLKILKKKNIYVSCNKLNVYKKKNILFFQIFKFRLV